MNDIRQLYRAAPGLVTTVAAMLAVAALLGITALFIT